MKISARNDACKYLGIWQENDAKEVVSYGTISWFEIGFTGECIRLHIRWVGDVEFFLDGVSVRPTEIGDGVFAIEARPSDHVLNLQRF